MFTARGANLKVFPESTPWSDIADWQPDGIFFSNGPGDPRVMPHARQQAEAAIASGYPLFGICLGHQLLALTAGLDVFKMYVGHRGANHPVQNLQTGRVEVTTQNHGFAVDPDSLKASIATLTHVNLNDRSVEGLDFSAFNGMSVQYHPEASPGPHDSRYLFDQFLDRVSAARNQTSPTA
jgi:carbamoyl-phosphate synthase small subunit